MEILKWKQHNKGSLIGFLDLLVPKWGNFIIYGIKVFKKDNKRWISFPASEQEKDGEKKYYPHNRFQEKDNERSFGIKVLEALDEYQSQNPTIENVIDQDDFFK